MNIEENGCTDDRYDSTDDDESKAMACAVREIGDHKGKDEGSCCWCN